MIERARAAPKHIVMAEGHDTRIIEGAYKATRPLQSKRPDLCLDGDLKAPKSKVARQANVFIFPDLNAGNIGYKIAERLGGAKAVGPISQGLNKPANNLSRGCSAKDVFNMIVVTVLQAQALDCLLYTSPSPRDKRQSRMPSSA